MLFIKKQTPPNHSAPHQRLPPQNKKKPPQIPKPPFTDLQPEAVDMAGLRDEGPGRMRATRPKPQGKPCVTQGSAPSIGCLSAMSNKGAANKEPIRSA